VVESACTVAATSRTRVRRKPERACYDRKTIFAILDEALFVSVAAVIEGQAHVQPMIHARVGEELILHGHANNRLLELMAGGAPACLNATLVDGLVLARRIEDHSFHYRSVTLFARASEVAIAADKQRLMQAVFESLVRSARYDALPELEEAYLATTRVLRLPIVEAVAKVNANRPGPDGPPGIWSGILPMRLTAGIPEPDERSVAEGLTPGPSISHYSR